MQSSGRNSFPSSDSASLSVLSNSLQYKDSPVVGKKIVSVYNTLYNNKVISFINKQQDSNLSETRNEIDDSVSLETDKDSSKSIKDSQLYRSDTRHNSDPLGDSRRTALDTKSFRIPSKIGVEIEPSKAVFTVSSRLLSVPPTSGVNRDVSTVVSRVQRHTAEPTRLEEFAFESTLLESPSGAGVMDSTDDARRGSNSGGSRTNAAHWSLPCRIDMEINPMSSPAYLSGHIYNNVNVAHKHVHRFKDTFVSTIDLEIKLFRYLTCICAEMCSWAGKNVPS